MDLKEIASIAGKGGLFRIVKPTRTGVIVESLDGKGARMVATANHRISVLKEISVYTTDAEGSVPLEVVLHKIYEEFGDDPGIDSSSSPEELKAFLQHILPEFDRDRVYVSDIKKLTSWYKILLQYAPETLKPQKTPENAVAPSEEKAEKKTAEKETVKEAGKEKEKAPEAAKKEKKEKAK